MKISYGMIDERGRKPQKPPRPFLRPALEKAKAKFAKKLKAELKKMGLDL